MSYDPAEVGHNSSRRKRRKEGGVTEVRMQQHSSFLLLHLG